MFRHSILLTFLVLTNSLVAQETKQSSILEGSKISEPKKSEQEVAEKKAHPYDASKVENPDSLHDYFINQLVETAKNIGARGFYLIAQEKDQDWKLPTIDASTAPLTHLFKSGVTQMDDRSLIERMFLRAANCESGAVLSDKGNSLAAFEKNCDGLDKGIITNAKAISALRNPKSAERAESVLDKGINGRLDYYSSDLLKGWLPYRIEDGTNGSLRKIITPEQFRDCLHICYLKAARDWGQDNDGVVIDPAKYKPEYKGAFAAEDPMVAKKHAINKNKKGSKKTTK